MFEQERKKLMEKHADLENWKELMDEMLKNTIDLYLKYHVRGELQEIRLAVNSEEAWAEIDLCIDQKWHTVNLDEYRVEQRERDEHRECYFAAEALWPELFIELEGEILSDFFMDRCKTLSECYGNIKAETVYDDY